MDELDQVEGLRVGDFGFDAGEGFVELQAGAIEELVSSLEGGDVGGFESGAAEADDVQAFGGDVEIGIKEDRAGRR